MDKGAAEHLFTPDEIKKYEREKIDIGRLVKTVTSSEGWKLFLGLYRKKALEVRAKDDYASLEDFRADRRAVTIVRELIDEFLMYEEDAEGASQLLIQLEEAERQTPTPLSFDIGFNPAVTREEG